MTENKAIQPIDKFRAQLAHKDLHQQVLNYFGGNEDITRKFESSAVHVVRKIPKLLECDRSTLMEALITCADLKLFPSSASGEAYILPYKGKAQFQIGYQGLITLFYRAGVETITSKIVYKNDVFEYEEGLTPKLIHKPNLTEKRGNPTHVYAIAVVNGEKLFHVMSEDDVMKFKKFSQSASSDFSPWNKNDPELWMWRKTCIKQLGKVLPKNETIHKAISRDNQDSTIAQIESRQIDTATLLEGAPTMGSLTNQKNGKENTKAQEEGQLFEVAGNNTEPKA